MTAPEQASPDSMITPFLGVDVDRAKDLLEWLWDHRDDLGRLASRVPDILNSASASIASAGAGADTAADLLIGNDAKPGARQLAESAGNTLESCQKELQRLTKLLGGIAQHLDDVNIPGINKPFDAAAEQLRDGASRLDSIGDSMGSVADTLRSLGAQVGDAANGLRTVGQHLGDTGTAFGSLLDEAPSTGSVGSIGDMLRTDQPTS